MGKRGPTSSYVYMKVTKDKYELPVAVASTARELEDILHLRHNSVLSALCHREKSGKRSCYVRVRVEDDEE